MQYLKDRCCCGCMSLRTASLFFGWVSLISAAMSVLRMSRMLDHAEEIQAALREGIDADQCDDQCFQMLTGVFFWLVVCSLVLDLVSCVFSACLVYGASHHRPALMSPYLLYHTSMLFLSLLAVGAAGIGLAMFGQAGSALLLLAVCAPLLAIAAYFLFVVRSHQVALETAGTITVACIEARLAPSRVYAPTTASPQHALYAPPTPPPAYFEGDDVPLVKG